jgi:hypothetical protein
MGVNAGRRPVRFIALLSLALITGVITAAAGGRSVGFHRPVKLPGSGKGGNEPSLAISTHGIRYASWQGPGEFARSWNGVRFQNVGVPDESAIGDVTNAVDATGALYNGQICGNATALHTCIYKSFDGGRTWPQQTIAADSHPGASDRPWIDVFPKKSKKIRNTNRTYVYLEYHTFSPEELAYVTVSSNGGKSFSEPKFITTDTNAVNSSGCNTVPGGVTTDRHGTVYALWLSGNDVAANAASGCNYSQIGPFNKAWVSTSTDHGNTWTAHLAWQGEFDQATRTGDNADKIFATIAVDRSGQVHVGLPVRHNDDPAGFVADCETNPDCQESPHDTDLLLVTSPDKGKHWTDPLKLNKGQGSNFFPWITAGSGGRVAGVYYASDTRRPNDDQSVWYIKTVRVGRARARVSGGSARYRSSPRITRRLLDRRPVHKGGICSFGVFCAAVPNANRNLADSIAIALTPKGGAEAVYTVDSPQQIKKGEESHIEYACQRSGKSAIARKGRIHRCYRGPNLDIYGRGVTKFKGKKGVRIAVSAWDNSHDSRRAKGKLRRFSDSRRDPPGKARHSFSCRRGRTTKIRKLSKRSVLMRGRIRCAGLRRVRRFKMRVKDHNPPRPDAYRVRLFGAAGRLLYHQSGKTTKKDLMLRVLP